MPLPPPLTVMRVKCSMPQGWTSRSDFVRSVRKGRVDLWHLATIEAAALFLRVVDAIVVVPVVIVIVIVFVAVNAMGVATVTIVSLLDWE